MGAGLIGSSIHRRAKRDHRLRSASFAFRDHADLMALDGPVGGTRGDYLAEDTP
jgi:hypothetical protein